MAGVFPDFKERFRRGTMPVRFIYLNVGIFLLLSVYRVVCWLFGISSVSAHDWVQGNLSLPSDLTRLALHPWTVLTYMFLHADVWHLFFNMLCLYGFGMLFLQFFSARHLRGLYILGGLFGALFFVSAQIFPAFRGHDTILVGASASVLALIAALGTAQPNFTVRLLLFGGIRMKYVAWGLVVLSFLSVPGGNAGGEVAHLGGAFCGWMFARLLQRGWDPTKGINWVFDLFQGIYKPRIPKRKSSPKGQKYRVNPEMKVHSAKRPEEWRSPGSAPAGEKQDISPILDKLKRSGYGSLSAEEKKRLFEASRK